MSNDLQHQLDELRDELAQTSQAFRVVFAVLTDEIDHPERVQLRLTMAANHLANQHRAAETQITEHLLRQMASEIDLLGAEPLQGPQRASRQTAE